jgi:N-acetylmuramoyl-L-alanine amidase
MPVPSAVPGVSSGSYRHRHFTDSSLFARVDRHDCYRSYPRQYYRLNYCNGYRGMGWYYGPPNFSYYYEAPYVMYFSSRSVIPSTYLTYSYTQPSQLEYEVQSALYELGYYNGPLDGAIGPMSRLAIANFQADNGLEPTGIIDETLLYYLGIQ